jgi:hypothetical protein
MSGQVPVIGAHKNAGGRVKRSRSSVWPLPNRRSRRGNKLLAKKPSAKFLDQRFGLKSGCGLREKRDT